MPARVPTHIQVSIALLRSIQVELAAAKRLTAGVATLRVNSMALETMARRLPELERCERELFETIGEDYSELTPVEPIQARKKGPA